jgi:hypothetical protein
MAYGVRYTASFNSIGQNNLSYTLNLRLKDYAGSSETIYLTENPIIQEWQEDNPKAPIKGSALKINILTPGVVTLETFYSNADDTWLVEFLCDTLYAGQFIGYLVQDDCAELQVDYYHSIQLTATDSLGLLKDNDFKVAAIAVGVTDPTIYLSLREIVKICLSSTKLELLGLKVASDLQATGAAHGRWLDDVYVKGKSFMTNDSQWMDCYKVLEQIMSRFYATCFQANGYWYIVRWGELYVMKTAYGATLTGHIYDANFDYSTNLSETNDFTFLSGNDLETGVIKSIIRPYQYVKETFEYKTPQQALCNYNMKNIGAFISGGIFGTGSYEDYVMNDWDPYNPAHPETYFIRIIYDSAGNESDRWGTVYTQNWDSQRGAKSCDIEVDIGQMINYSFDFITEDSNPGAGNVNFIVTLSDGTTTKILNNDGDWVTYGAWNFTWFNGDDLNQWHTVNIKSNQTPYKGVINIYLAHCSSSNNVETYYKNLSLELTYGIIGSRQIVGHFHNDLMPYTISNNKDFDIFLDDTKVATASGTLFLDGYTSLCRNKTTTWNDQGLSVRPLGYVTTVEEMFQRYKARSKYSGNYLKIIESSRMLIPAAVFSNQINADLRFVPGSITINYKNETADITLYELVDVGDSISSVESADTYTFDYLYQNKQ